MTRYGEHVSGLKTSQREKARENQVENNAGGFVFQLDMWARLDRFLILGTEGGTYYVDEKKHTKQAAAAVKECLAADFKRTVNRIVEISESGRAIKNDPAIFALAMAAGDPTVANRTYALAAMPRVCRIGTHLFHFVADVGGFRRWGRGLRKGIARWYTEKTAPDLAFQLVKYQSRDKWSHKSVIQLAHPSAPSEAHNALFRYVVRGMAKFGDRHEGTYQLVKNGPERVRVDSDAAILAERIKGLPPIVAAFEEIHSGVGANRAVQLIKSARLPHECVPNELKDQPKVWEAMLPSMGLTAMIRNLGKMSSIGLLSPLSSASKLVVETITDKAALKKARVHPMTILIALRTYQSGHGFRGSLTWNPDRSIVDALDEAFYMAFDAIEPTGKNMLLALDVSGSMGSTMNNTNLSCREASAAMAMVTARTEKNWHCVGFTSGGRGYGGKWGGAATQLTPLKISPRQRLDDVVKAISGLDFGGTDCALPMLYAAGKELDVDAFCVYTDNETWAGSIHPFQALKAYRQKQNKPRAKLVVVGMTATEFSIADPSDADSLDVVGFDASAPTVIADFVRDADPPRASVSTGHPFR